MIKLFFRRIHLYLGLAAGLVIMVSCLTGALLVFEEELQHAFHHSRYYVTPGTQQLSLDALAQNLDNKVPGISITGYKLYKDKESSVEITYKPREKKKVGFSKEGKRNEAPKKAPGPGEGETILRAFMNPYTGEVIELYNHKQSFFYRVMALHRWLLAGSAGKLITGISTFIFLFMIITGIILWWPATRNILRQRLKVKWGAGGRRLNHDLHIVFGFYASICLFFIAFTALAWSFEWFNDGIYKVTKSGKERPKQVPSLYTGVAPVSMQAALTTVQAACPDAVYYQLSKPKDSAGPITATVLNAHAAHETATDQLYIDQYSGKLSGIYYFSDRNLGARVRATFKPVHTGSIWGLPSKILALVVCLVGCTLPVTGVIKWIRRMKR